MKDEIRDLLESYLALVDFDSDTIYAQLDSLGITTIMMLLSEQYHIHLDATDATPENLNTLDSIVAMVQSKLGE